MAEKVRKQSSVLPLQRLVAEPIEDPEERERILRILNQPPRKPSVWGWRMVIGGAVAAALIVGVLLGRFVF
jgi:hypothetical protein